jgi:Spy/CpxP family protein refolding chaperone
MHQGMFGWLHAHRREAMREAAEACGEHAGCGGHARAHAGPWGHRGGGHGGPGGFGGRGPGDHEHDHGPDGGGEGGFGVRRPLRFLAFKLELEEAQVTELAAILSELKTERAQSSVDQRRTTSSLADAVSGEAFDDAKARSAADERTKSTERVQVAVVRALGRIHALLTAEQRVKLAYLLRTGTLSI